MSEAAAIITSPEAERELNARLADALRGLRGTGVRETVALTLYGPSGEAVGALTASALEALEAALTCLAESDEIMLGSRDAELSPETAAKILGVSRPVVYHRMDSGRLAFRRIGSHRRVLYKDVLALMAFEEERRAFSKAMSEDTDEQAEPVPRG